jgi:hypothetical protein
MNNLTTLVTIHHWVHYRDYFDWQYVSNRKTISEWVTLTAGQKYYMDAKQAEATGHDHMTVSVEVEKTPEIPDNHFHAMKEIQYVSAQSNGAFEVSTLTIDNVDNGLFKMVLLATNGTPTATGTISANSTADELKGKLEKWFSGNVGSGIKVERFTYNAAGNVTTNLTECTKSIYNITLTKFIVGKSNSNMMVTKTGTTSTITIQPSVVESGAPLRGKFRFKCIDDRGYMSYSKDISYNAHENTVKYAIAQHCTGLNDKIEVWKARGAYASSSNGIGFYIRYSGKNTDPGQITLESSNVTAVTGENVTYYANTTIPFGQNVFYEPVPFEWLRTYETKPQVVVKIDGEPAVCHNMTCDYNYTVPVGEVTGFSYDATSMELTVTGTDLPQNVSMVRGVMFAKSPCLVTEATNTSLKCTLMYKETCGNHVPYITHQMGLVNNSASLTPLTVNCAVSSVHPTTQLNLLGRDNLTFTGTNLPWFLNTSSVQINFTDSQQTGCIPQWDMSTSETLVCLTEPFLDSDAGTSFGLTITINEITVTQTLTVSTMSNKKSGVQLVPNTASPVLKTKVNITLESSFPYTLDKADFTVNATNISNPTYFRQMNVIAVHEPTKSLMVMFGGAWSGDYLISIRHRAFGLIDNKDLLFIVGSNVTNVTPNTGSKYGGTLLTITGTNFGKVKTDNPVQISTLGAVGSIDCFVKTTNATTITCRVGKTNKADG